MLVQIKNNENPQTVAELLHLFPFELFKALKYNKASTFVYKPENNNKKKLFLYQNIIH